MREYPPREQIKAAASGVFFDQDVNDGNPIGMADMIENRLNGNRIVISIVYPLNGVDILTDTLVKRLIVENINGSKQLLR